MNSRLYVPGQPITRRLAAGPIGYRRNGSPIWPIAGGSPAITFTATRGTANGGTTASTTIALSPSLTLDIADEIVVVVTADNVGTTSADDTGEISSVADNSTQTGAANTWSKLKERRTTQAGAAADGAVVAIFRSRLTRSILSTDTITVTYANSVAGRTVSLMEVAATAALQLATNGVATQSVVQGTAISLTLSSLTSKEYLLVAAFAQEGGTNITYTEDADYTQRHRFSTGGIGAADMSQGVATRIATLTTDTYAVTLSANRDVAAILIALEESGGTTFNQSMAGTVTPAGALTNSTSKILAATITPAGALTKQIAKIFAGTITPAGVVANTKVILRSFAGTITPAGALVRSVGKVVAGTITPAGSITKRISRTLAGQLTPVGALVRSIGKLLTGSTSPAGSVSVIQSAPTAQSFEYGSSVVTTDLSSGASGGDVATSSSGME